MVAHGYAICSLTNAEADVTFTSQSMSLELEVLDQLEGGDLPLSVVASLFPDEAHARRAIAALMVAGEVDLSAEGAALAPWQLRDLERQSTSWREDTRHRLALTDVGARRIRG